MRGLVLAFTVLVFIAGGESEPVAVQNVATGQRSPAPRTPWGDPDLQGLWNFGTNTPLQRPPKWAGRELLTEEEVAAANLEWSTFATSERRSALTPEYDLSLNFNQFWWDLGTSTGRTSLITDPGDGRLPPLTPERQAYEAMPEANRLQAVRWGLAPARGPEDLELMTAVSSTGKCRLPRAATTITSRSCKRPDTSSSFRKRSMTSVSCR